MPGKGWRRVRRTAWLILVLLAAMIAALWAVLGTRAGTAWVLGEAATRAGVQLSYDSLRGSALARLEFDALHLRSGDTEVEVEHAVLQWRPGALVSGRLVIEELRALGVSVTTPPAAPDSEPQFTVPELPAVSLPIPVQIRVLEVSTLRLGGADAAPVLDRLVLALDASGHTMRVHVLSLAHEHFAASGEFSLQLRDDWPVLGHIALSSTREEQPLELRVALGGSARMPEVELEASAPLTARARVRADLRGERPDASVELHWSDAALAAAAPLTSPQGTVQLSLDGQRVEIRLDTRLDGAPGALSQLTLDAHGTLESFLPPFPLELALEWSAQLDAGAFSGSGQVRGDLFALHLEHTLHAPFELSTAGEIALDGADTRVDLAGQWRELAWPPGTLDGPRSPSGSYRIAGGIAALEVSVDAAVDGAGGVQQIDARVRGGASLQAPHAFTGDLTWSARTEALGAVSGSGRLHGDQGQVHFTHRLSGADATRLDAQGSATLAPRLALDLSGSWSALRWPLHGEAQASSPSGNFAVHGQLGALQARVEAAIEAAPVGPVALRASALIGDADAREVELHADLLGGSVSARGQVDWAPVPGVVLDIRARDIDPARLHPQALGRVDAHLGVDVHLHDERALGAITLHALSGTLGDYPLRGEGRVALTTDGFEAEQIALGTGDNTLTLSGRIGELLDLRYRIDAPSLRQLWPGLAGSIKGEGTLSGSPGAPLVNAQLNADAVRVGDTRVGSASLSADVDLGEERQSTVRARARGVVLAGVQFDDTALTLDGTRGQHQLTLQADTSEGRLALEARGALHEKSWDGELQTLSLERTALGDWQLANPVAIAADARGAQTGEACLQSQGARLCVNASRERPGEQSLALALSSLEVTRFSPWLPANVTLSGAIDASGSALSRDGGPWNARATLSATPIRLAMNAPDALDTPIEMTLQQLEVEASHTVDGSQARLSGRLGESGNIRGEVQVGPASPAGSPLAGSLQAMLPDLAPFAALVPTLRDLAGRLEADLSLAGSTAQPQLRGDVSLSEAGATIPAAGITVERTSLRVSGTADGDFSVQGLAHSGGGSITLRGEGRVADGDYRARVNISGTGFEAMRTLEVQALISPELVLDASAQRISLSGRVLVPRARINIQELPPGVVQLSGDEVIRGREPEPASVWRERLQVAVELSLGGDVHVNAFGLDTRLTGGLAIGAQGSASPTARGAVSLVDGRFNAYGQDLQIRRGRLLFTGPLDNPGLDFRAVRDAGEVVAGIEVSGTADRMRSRLFSEPSLPQAEALAWLLTGRGLSGASADDGSVLASAAVSLGLERSEQVTRQIGSALGLDELSVAPGGSLDQSALVLGKALTPRLYIRYALGLLDGQGSVQLDYKLTDRISVEAESGTRQGADVIYRLER